jgi:hypothetical protein
MDKIKNMSNQDASELMRWHQAKSKADELQRFKDFELSKPYSGTEAFQEITPNKYGGSKNWLDEYQIGGYMMQGPYQKPSLAKYTPTLKDVLDSIPQKNLTSQYQEDLGYNKRVAKATEQEEREKRQKYAESLNVYKHGEKPAEYVPVEAAFMPASRGFGWLGNAAIDMMTGTMRSPGKHIIPDRTGPDALAEWTRNQLNLKNQPKLGKYADEAFTAMEEGAKHMGTLGTIENPRPILEELDGLQNSELGPFSFAKETDIPEMNESIKQYKDYLTYGEQPLLKDFQFAQTPQDVLAMMGEHVRQGEKMPHWFDLTNPMDQRRKTLSKMIQEERMSSNPAHPLGDKRGLRYDTGNAFTELMWGPKSPLEGWNMDRVLPSNPAPELFQKITPNKFGGSKNWLDNYNS